MPAENDKLQRLTVLDGWRALSILLVMGGHLLPIGPGRWELNSTVAASGMAIFFTLSGFLITRFLIEDGNIARFLIRRILRIVPLAWTGALLAYLVAGGSANQLLGTMAFIANLPPWFLLLPAGGHFWSLSVEMQFYAAIATIVTIAGSRGLKVLPWACLAVTSARIIVGAPISIVTWLRIDEILAGATLALAYEGWLGANIQGILHRINPLILIPFVLASSHPDIPILNYARPYLSALMVGSSLYAHSKRLNYFCTTRPIQYISKISFALYVFHGILSHTWLGSGDSLIKYAKRPILFLSTFFASHVSTNYFEKYFINLARRRSL